MIELTLTLLAFSFGASASSYIDSRNAGKARAVARQQALLWAVVWPWRLVRYIRG